MATPIRLLLARSGPMPGASTTCWAMSGNGRRIAGTGAMLAPLRMAAPGQSEIVECASFAAVPGTTIPGACALPSAAGTTRATGTTTPASAWPGRSHKERYLLCLYVFTSWGKSRRGCPPSGRAASESVTHLAMRGRDHARTSVAARNRFLPQLVPSVAKDPRSWKSLPGNRLQATILDGLERRVEATTTRPLFSR
jgi:hypothetical protein